VIYFSVFVHKMMRKLMVFYFKYEHQYIAQSLYVWGFVIVNNSDKIQLIVTWWHPVGPERLLTECDFRLGHTTFVEHKHIKKCDLATLT